MHILDPDHRLLAVPARLHRRDVVLHPPHIRHRRDVQAPRGRRHRSNGLLHRRDVQAGALRESAGCTGS